MIKTNLSGVPAMMFELRTFAQKVPDTARKQMYRSADRIVREAQLNAPVDKGNLEDAIVYDYGYGYRGRLEIDIKILGEVNGINVSQYAIEMHENYESYKPGPGTIAKREANPGRYVGGKFLERAVDDETSKLAQKLVEVIKEVIRR